MPGTSPGMTTLSRGASCVDGPRLARDNFACRTEVACSHVSGLFPQPGGLLALMESANRGLITQAGSSLPMKRQASLGCVGSTDCAITRHYSLASSSTGVADY